MRATVKGFLQYVAQNFYVCGIQPSGSLNENDSKDSILSVIVSVQQR